MFLDPEPRPPRHTMSSGFFSSRNPIASPRDVHRTAIRRKALHERSESQNNQARTALSSREATPEKSTVRLIPYSSPPAMRRPTSKEAWALGDSAEKENDPMNTLRRSRWAVPKGSKDDAQVLASDEQAQGTDQSDFDISDTTAFSIGDDASRTPRPITERVPRIPPPVVIPIPKPAWHRRSVSSGIMSDSSTLYFQRDGDGSLAFADNIFPPSESRRQTQLSFDTTLQGTPTPYESEAAEAADLMKPPPIQSQPLQVWPEASPERSTVRVIDSPGGSEASEEDTRPQSSQASLPHADTDLPDELVYDSAMQNSDVSRLHSTSSIPNIEAFGSSPPRIERDDSAFMMSDDSRLPEFSSPVLSASSRKMMTLIAGLRMVPRHLNCHRQISLRIVHRRPGRRLEGVNCKAPLPSNRSNHVYSILHLRTPIHLAVLGNKGGRRLFIFRPLPILYPPCESLEGVFDIDKL